MRVYRLSNPDRDDYALFPESELAAMQAQGYRTQAGLDPVVGYAYPNVDSDFDNLIDGWEMILGTDPLNFDSDCDGVSDGACRRWAAPGLGD